MATKTKSTAKRILSVQLTLSVKNNKKYHKTANMPAEERSACLVNGSKPEQKGMSTFGLRRRSGFRLALTVSIGQAEGGRVEAPGLPGPRREADGSAASGAGAGTGLGLRQRHVGVRGLMEYLRNINTDVRLSQRGPGRDMTWNTCSRLSPHETSSLYYSPFNSQVSGFFFFWLSHPVVIICDNRLLAFS